MTNSSVRRAEPAVACLVKPIQRPDSHLQRVDPAAPCTFDAWPTADDAPAPSSPDATMSTQPPEPREVLRHHLETTLPTTDQNSVAVDTFRVTTSIDASQRLGGLSPNAGGRTT